MLGPVFALRPVPGAGDRRAGLGAVRAGHAPAPRCGAGFGTPGQIGELLLNRFLLPFEAASFLLLVAAVGAVVMARKRRGLEEPESALGAITVRDPLMEGADQPGRGARGGPDGRAY